MTSSYNTIKIFRIYDDLDATEESINTFFKEHKDTMAEDYYFKIFEHLKIAVIFYYDVNFNKK